MYFIRDKNRKAGLDLFEHVFLPLWKGFIICDRLVGLFFHPAFLKFFQYVANVRSHYKHDGLIFLHMECCFDHDNCLDLLILIVFCSKCLNRRNYF